MSNDLTPMNPPPPSEEQIFQAAAVLPAEERGSYLDAACGENLDLRARLERLLTSREAPGFMDAPPLDSDIAAELARLKPEEAGERIGPYKLLQQIGEGGFGTVWMADQEQPVRRRVALKIIKLGMDTKEVIARFEQERQALAMMEHPNIARVLDAGATQHGRPYFVMELVRGIKITDYCDQASLPTADRLQLFIAVCQAVQHAHQKGIIHRDLKPSNILVTLHDGTPVPKVIDFGVAKATQARLTERTLFTQFQQMVGTPLYMSPEQAEMSGLDIDTRSDIYSLGVLLYELLTGRTPFDLETLQRAGLDEIRRIIREQEPVKPSTALQTLAADARTDVARHRQSDGAKLTGLLRGDLDWIVMKALEKERGRRYETASGLAGDIQRHLNTEPILARPPSSLYRFQKLVRRNKVAFASAAAVVATLVIGMGLFTWSAIKERDALRRAVLAEKRAFQEARLRELDRFIHDGGNIIQSATQRLERTREALALRRELFGSENEDVVDLLRNLAGTDGFDAKATIQEALSIQRRLADRDYIVVYLLIDLASIALWSGNLEEAAATYREAVEVQKKVMLAHPKDEYSAPSYLAKLARAIENKKQPRSIPGWGEVSSSSDEWTYAVENQKLTLTVPRGHYLFDPIQRYSRDYSHCAEWYAMSAPRILQRVDGDFTLQVKLAGAFDVEVDEHDFWNSAGLLLWHSDKDYFFIGHQQSISIEGGEKKWQKVSAFLCQYAAAGIERNLPDVSRSRSGGRPIHLRMSRRGNTVTADASNDGMQWDQVRSVNVPFPESVSVGVLVENGTDKPFVVEFSDFKLTKPTNE